MPRSDDEKIPYFRPRWFKALLLGRLSFGDTFWAGLFGSALIFVPVGVVMAMLISVIDPAALDSVLIFNMGLYAIYMTLLIRVVLLTGWKSPESGGWRWFGMIYVLVHAGLQYAVLWDLIKNGSDLLG